MKLQSNAFRDYSAEQKVFVRRAFIAFVGVLLLSSVLVVNLYHLQILRFDDYSTRSNDGASCFSSRISVVVMNQNLRCSTPLSPARAATAGMKY